MVSWNLWTHRKIITVSRILVITSLLLALVGQEKAHAQQGYIAESLFIVLYSTGDALVEYDVQVTDPLADAVPVKLFGNTRSNLLVTDFEDRFVTTRAGTSPSEIVLTPAGATNIRISYTTSDLVSKDGREWTFVIDSPVGFSVKMPSESIPIDYGEIRPDLTQIGSQMLLTFRAGSASVTYIIGFLGTEEQARLRITVAGSAINDAKNTNPGIILTGAEELLAMARAAFDVNQFVDAERLATEANDKVEATIEDYAAAVAIRAEARMIISQAIAENRDMTGANALWEQSNWQFEAGDYANAADSAEDAIRVIGPVRQSVWPYGIGAVVAGVIAGAFYFIRKRQAPRQQATHAGTETITRDSKPVHKPEQAPSVPDTPAVPVAKSAPKPAGVPESQTDATLLAAIVHKMIEEKPHLREEDRDVLVYLAQNEGAAFESEVRAKFQLPKTTVWRLVKRLEREELVEIRKAGGQNLIKLRFEGRQP